MYATLPDPSPSDKGSGEPDYSPNRAKIHDMELFLGKQLNLNSLEVTTQGSKLK